MLKRFVSWLFSGFTKQAELDASIYKHALIRSEVMHGCRIDLELARMRHYMSPPPENHAPSRHVARL